MPKFYCTHCGQRINAPDELAGNDATCPTCKVELKIPEVQTSAILESETEPIVNQPLNSVSTKSKKGFFDLKLGDVFFWVLGYCILASFIRPPSQLEQIGFGNRNIVSTIFEALGRFATLALIALCVTLIIAGIAYARNKNFRTPLQKYYSITLIIIAFIAIIGDVIGRL